MFETAGQVVDLEIEDLTLSADGSALRVRIAGAAVAQGPLTIRNAYGVLGDAHCQLDLQLRGIEVEVAASIKSEGGLEISVSDVQLDSFRVGFQSSAGLAESGDFFAVNFTVSGVGTVEINIIEVVDITVDEGDPPDVTLPENAIQYTSRPAGVIPEPSSILVWLVGAAFILMPRCRRFRT